MTPGERNPFDLPSCRDSLTPANGNGHKRFPTRQIHSDAQAERKLHLKLAAFCLAVAAVLILAHALGRVELPPNSTSDWNPVRDVVLAVHPRPNSRTRQGVVVSFRLSNIGRQPIFYPAHPGTSLPVGEILVRNGTSSEWIKARGASEAAASREMESTLRWIELPPGGSIDGEFDDQVEVPGDHAYQVFLKADHTSAAVRIESEPYHYSTK